MTSLAQLETPTFDTVRPKANGRWRELLPRFGIPSTVLDGKHHPCPGCGGKDRFRFDDLEGTGTFICSQGGKGDHAGDGLGLLIHAGKATSPAEALHMVAESLGADGPETRSVTLKTPHETRHEYTGPDGQLSLIVTRTDLGDGKKKFSQKTARGLSPSKDDQFEYVPYNLDEILNSSDAIIHIVEGEKCADMLTALGLVATCNAGGAGNWQVSLNQYFEGRDVVILPDNDEAGEAHFLDVADQLEDIAKTVKVCRLSDLPPKGDVVDWFKQGNVLSELVNEVSCAESVDNGLGITLAELLAAEYVVPEPVHKHIPAGITLFGGAAKAGKSTFCEWIAYEVAQEAPVIYLALEYAPPMAQDRFRWMAGPQLNMRLFTQDQAPRMGDGGEAWLDRILRKIKPRLVVIDTLARFKRQADHQSYEAETEAMAELSALFNKHAVSAVIIHHTRKGNQHDDPENRFERMLGSTALAAVPDSLIVLEANDGKSVLHTRGRMTPQSKKIFILNDNRFELDDSPGAILGGKADVQASILNLLKDGPATQKVIAEKLDLQTSHVRNYIKKLSNAGLVKKGPPVELITKGGNLF